MRFFSTWIVCISFLLPGFAAEFKVGQSWNESVASRDPLSGLEIRQLTTKGIYNQGPTIHKDTAFPGGKDEVIFAAFRENATLLMSGNLKNGTLTIHDVQPGRYPAPGPPAPVPRPGCRIPGGRILRSRVPASPDSGRCVSDPRDENREHADCSHPVRSTGRTSAIGDFADCFSSALPTVHRK